MSTLSKILLVIHIVIGSLAVIVGLLALIVRKPAKPNTGSLHRRNGNLFVICMSGVIALRTGRRITMSRSCRDEFFKRLS